MKKTILKFSAAAVAILGFSAMQILAPAGISGKITPVDGAESVWAIKDADSVKAMVSTEGAFQLEVKPGSYKLVVSAKAPYQNTEVKDVVVTADNTTDVGEIKLAK